MKYILGLGSNLGEKELLILQAVSMIKEQIGSVQEISAMYKSAPIGFESENEFLNCCISIETVLSPLILLREIKKIEDYSKSHLGFLELANNILLNNKAK